MDRGLLIAFIGMGVVTYAARAVSIVLLPGRRLHPVVRRWLEYVPVSVLAGLAAPAILAPHGALRLGATNPWLIAAVPTVAIALWRRSLWLTIVVGVAAFAIALHFGLAA